MTSPNAWMADALCRQHPDLGWLKDEHMLGLGEISTMDAICANCPVRSQCERFVAEQGISGGFWAGEDRDVVQDRRRWGEQRPLPGMGDVA